MVEAKEKAQVHMSRMNKDQWTERVWVKKAIFQSHIYLEQVLKKKILLERSVVCKTYVYQWYDQLGHLFKKAAWYKNRFKKTALTIMLPVGEADPTAPPGQDQ